MKVGEKMSEWVVFESLHWSSNGDVYETMIDSIRDRPLDTARLFYVKLRTALDEDDHVEVIWNHITNLIAIDVENKAGRHFESEFAPTEMARSDLVQHVDQFVDTVRRVVDADQK